MKIPVKLNEREKKFVFYGAVAAAVIVVYSLFSWYIDLKSRVDEVSETRMYMLEKQIREIAGKEALIKKVEDGKKRLVRMEKSFLSGETPPVAAAALQKFLKSKATSLNIEVKLERTLNPVETEYYLGIPVEIGFTATTEELKNLLVQLRESKVLLTVSEIKLRVTNVSKPTDVYTSLVVTGFINKPEPEESGRSGAKNDT